MKDRAPFDPPTTRPQRLYALLAAVFLTGLLVADTTGGKLVALGGRTLSAGVIPFFVTFLVTDLINEFYGRRGARFVTFVAFGMAGIVVPIFLLQDALPAAPGSPVDQEAFRRVFVQSVRIWIGSLTAFLVGQLVDIQTFHWFRRVTRSRHIWLRATGSTVISQGPDTFLVLFLYLWGRPKEGGGVWAAADILPICRDNYLSKVAVAVGVTPLIYLGHRAIRRYLEGGVRFSPVRAASLATASLEEAEARGRI
ncbi:MAG TPA: queuosine precursor transporter [Planctomycetota bacterium]|jgi:hypothetical protein|nr:queuosine precursor transporter [Planctomycetota bacterium]